ncbi:unnamed protein product [Closterium sp. Naga37s-1]|nr:unnamed protein product [Closterium sp. Naga37s-1]
MDGPIRGRGNPILPPAPVTGPPLAPKLNARANDLAEPKRLPPSPIACVGGDGGEGGHGGDGGEAKLAAAVLALTPVFIGRKFTGVASSNSPTNRLPLFAAPFLALLLPFDWSNGSPPSPFCGPAPPFISAPSFLPAHSLSPSPSPLRPPALPSGARAPFPASSAPPARCCTRPSAEDERGTAPPPSSARRRHAEQGIPQPGAACGQGAAATALAEGSARVRAGNRSSSPREEKECEAERSGAAIADRALAEADLLTAGVAAPLAEALGVPVPSGGEEDALEERFLRSVGTSGVREEKERFPRSVVVLCSGTEEWNKERGSPGDVAAEDDAHWTMKRMSRPFIDVLRDQRICTTDKDILVFPRPLQARPPLPGHAVPKLRLHEPTQRR